MIQLISEGIYKLAETKAQHKMLSLNKRHTYAWIEIPDDFYEILVAAHETKSGDHILSVGKYRLYHVENEPYLTSHEHLELYVGENMWQGYLLPTGLPRKDKKRCRILPTKEIITKTIHYSSSDSSPSSASKSSIRNML